MLYILYKWKTADRIEAGFSLNNRAKGAENMTHSGISNINLNQLDQLSKKYFPQ